MFLAMLIWKLFNASFQFNIGDVGFQEVLSLSMVLFAIGLSAAFYFKATETSNRFYDNVNKFTKDTSEILGRIEAGFGEKLRHIDESYSGIRNKFDMLPSLTDTREKVALEEKEVKKKEAERDALLEELANRAKLVEKEKKLVLQKMQQSDRELSDARMQLQRLQHRLEKAEIREDTPGHILDFTRKEVVPRFPKEASDAELYFFFNKLKETLPRGYIRDLEKYGFTNKNSDLTKKGLDLIGRQATT